LRRKLLRVLEDPKVRPLAGAHEVTLVNPPRRGLSPAVRGAIARLGRD